MLSLNSLHPNAIRAAGDCSLCLDYDFDEDGTVWCYESCDGEFCYMVDCTAEG